ncbi:MAG: hypothetical protein H0A76_09910 [Candidatus Thiodubiliella endoseptemdiera]|uniref:Uncharacterized protein n=1 Tax=Candidatus Thiodubiliella endoseptemdiera TaxID=2738886 RepID=A0A853F575_9GAMM|nr:hypothetical protein [Candidatus Thiodubiliella endoseptemdiera]
MIRNWCLNIAFAWDNIAATDFDIGNPTSDITLNNITDVAGNAPVFTADRVVLTKTA